MAEKSEIDESVLNEFFKLTIQRDHSHPFLPFYLPFKDLNHKNNGQELEANFYLEIFKLLKLNCQYYSVFTGIDQYNSDKMCDACIFYKEKQFLIEIKSERRERKHSKISTQQLQKFVDSFGRTQEITTMVFTGIKSRTETNIIDFLKKNCDEKAVKLPTEIKTRREIEKALMEKFLKENKCKTEDDAFDKLLMDRTYNMVRKNISSIEKKNIVF